MKLPEIKKKISSYLLGEEGKISKQSLAVIGATIANLMLINEIYSQTPAPTPPHNNCSHTNYTTVQSHMEDNFCYPSCGTLPQAETSGLCGNCCHTNNLSVQGTDANLKRLSIAHGHDISHCNGPPQREVIDHTSHFTHDNCV